MVVVRWKDNKVDMVITSGLLLLRRCGSKQRLSPVFQSPTSLDFYKVLWTLTSNAIVSNEKYRKCILLPVLQMTNASNKNIRENNFDHWIIKGMQRRRARCWLASRSLHGISRCAKQLKLIASVFFLSFFVFLTKLQLIFQRNKAVCKK